VQTNRWPSVENYLDDSKTRVSFVSWEQHGRYLLTVHAGSGVEAA
jgi:hypothetical protein